SFFDVYVDLTPPGIAGLTPVAPAVRSTPVGSIDVVFSEPVNPATFDFHDLRLTRDGAPVPLDGGGTITPVLIDPAAAQAASRIGGLAGLTAGAGAYVLTVDGSGVEDFAGNAGTTSAADSWVNNQPPQVAPPSRSQQLFEGTSAVIDLGSFTDPGGGSSPWT